MDDVWFTSGNRNKDLQIDGKERGAPNRLSDH